MPPKHGKFNANITSKAKDYQYASHQCQKLVNSLKICNSISQCLEFFSHLVDERIFLIVSGSLGEQILPSIKDSIHIHSIYVFCCDKVKHQLWAERYEKVKEVFTQIEPLCHLLEENLRQCNESLVSISVVSQGHCLVRDFNLIDPSFMYSKLFNEILLEIDDDGQMKRTFLDFCSIQYGNNGGELKIIEEFKNTYSSSTVIWWYTRQCFLYAMLNRALRTIDLEILLKIGFFIRDLHQEIERLHRKSTRKDPLTVYRGQGMSHQEFNKVRHGQGGLLCFNNFLSTSRERQTALNFARRAKKDSSLVPIFFQIDIDPSKSSAPFADIRAKSFYSDRETEILFSVNTIFRIELVKPIKEDLWKIHLTITDQKDQQLQELTNFMRNETRGLTGWHRLGSLMIAMGQYNKAEEFYSTAIEMTSPENWKDLTHLYSQMGKVFDEKNDSQNALHCYEEALEIQLKHLPANDPALAMTYTGIGSILHVQDDYDEALEYFQYALDIILPNEQQSNALQLATIYNHMGAVYNDQMRFSEALNCYQQAFNIRQRELPEVHPLLAATLNNIGLVHQSMNDHGKALSYYEKTLHIEKKTLPKNHPSLAVTYHNMAHALERLYRYKEAIEHQKSAVDILRLAYGDGNFEVQREKDDLEKLRQKLE